MLHAIPRVVFFLGLLIAYSPLAQAQLGNLFGSAPKVDILSTTDLKAMLDMQKQKEETAASQGQGKPNADFVLVDVRSDAEVNISVIPGAITKAEYEKSKDKYKDKQIICYCTVGGRSTKYSTELAKEGLKVLNYKGSILDWVNSELPLVTLDGKPTNRVHIYADRYKIPAKYEAVTE